ncbi:DUF4224 domain-containing protein [Janthinobacterium sp. PAMC25594]|uniref:DUF4224 domain-containing protein n=1 Tax=Janthinobacterium sp. PAMC25594 TaxID=2861284 RepID=UPI002158EC2E|nr:DUF4224 domain-containing protein [Janthinobacterium sp. PAMC25594]
MMHAQLAGVIPRSSQASRPAADGIAENVKSSGTFLTADDVAILTGRKLKSLQVKALRTMGIPFFINAIGRPVVARTAVDGKTAAAPQEKSAWVPPGLRAK